MSFAGNSRSDADCEGIVLWHWKIPVAKHHGFPYYSSNHYDHEKSENAFVHCCLFDGFIDFRPAGGNKSINKGDEFQYTLWICE